MTSNPATNQFLIFGRFLVLAVAMVSLSSPLLAQSLDDDLKRQPFADLAAAAKRDGDAARGAIVFFQQYMACSKCHSVGGEPASSLGPDLVRLGSDVRDDQLVEAVLEPSKVIRKGFESVTVTKIDGTVVSGIRAAETPEQVSLRDAARNGELITIHRSHIEDLTVNQKSLMPAGQVNQLTSPQQFLDLIRYLMEIRDGGAARARALQPSPSLLIFALPEYENHLDHAGLIKGWDADSLKRGEEIYRRVCMNCHGTKDQPGSLPTSLRFAAGRFKNGHDPYVMYQSITRGFGLMAAQTWMVPRQKYDVIHYIRETYLRPHNPSQYSAITDEYLARLPQGDTQGPEPLKIEPWSAMDYGPTLSHTYEVPGAASNFAYKGIAIRLDPGPGGVARGRYWSLFDTDTLRISAVWKAEYQPKSDSRFIDWRDIQFNGEHGIHPTIVGSMVVANSTNPGWANPETGRYLDELRVEGRDGKRYGPLPRPWAQFKGLYHCDNRAVMSYTVGSTKILESPHVVLSDQPEKRDILLRTLNIGPRKVDLEIQLTERVPPEYQLPPPIPDGNSSTHYSPPLIIESTVAWLCPRPEDKQPCIRFVESSHWGIAPQDAPVQWVLKEGKLRLKVLQGDQPLKFSIWTTHDPRREFCETDPSTITPFIPAEIHDLEPLTKGGPPRWTQTLETPVQTGADDGPFATDTLTLPHSNPWLAQLRLTGLDFLSDGRMAVCTWDGDVWIIQSIAPSPTEASSTRLRWQRIASGLFQPLGLKVINDTIYLTCRDQLCVLRDLNGDGETDYYECLNNDHQVTPHFHEFAMGLQVDDRGNFYYAKSARHALEAVVPHHGTLLRVSQDGSKTEILANGFRAANGVCLNPDGSFVVTDQEGHWNPKNRINWVTLDPSGKPKFYGNMFGYHDVTNSADSAMEPPLCWITNAFDRSPAELLWVKSRKWGPLDGALLNLSYGYGKVYVVPHEKVQGVMQGGMIALPIPSFPTGVMRGRFNPADDQLYLCGMFSWAGNATQPGGLYRLRATGLPMNLPVGLHATRSGIKIDFTDPLDPASVDPAKLAIKIWSLKRTANYGSNHYDETPLKVSSCKVSPDAKSVTIEIERMRPTWCMEISFAFRSQQDKPVEGTIHNTVHELGE